MLGIKGTEIIKEFGKELTFECVILDLGCGSGETVAKCREDGYQVFGCDFDFTGGPQFNDLQNDGILRLIEKSPYRLPFDDNTFDFVFSEQVFEHVRDYPATLSEIKRVLKPDGCNLHEFPSRYMFIERHTFVPFASIIQRRWWLFVWASLGVRNQFQKGCSIMETVNHNYNYLRKNTNYPKRSELKKYIKKYFNNVVFCEKIFLKHSRKRRIRFLYHASRILPFIPWLISTFVIRVVFFNNE